MVHGREGIKRCLVLYRSKDLGHFVCIVGKINNMLLCVKIILIYADVMY